MDVPTLVATADLEPGVAAEVQALLAAKARMRELGAGEPPETLRAFVEAELGRAASFEAVGRASDRTAAQDRADAWFRAAVG